jgi:hypothetical protein
MTSVKGPCVFVRIEAHICPSSSTAQEERTGCLHRINGDATASIELLFALYLQSRQGAPWRRGPGTSALLRLPPPSHTAGPGSGRRKLRHGQSADACTAADEPGRPPLLIILTPIADIHSFISGCLTAVHRSTNNI